jgi:hypothetical protein
MLEKSVSISSNMAKIQISIWQRFWGWVLRHKVLSVIAVLVFALVVYVLVLWIVFALQVHFERERFDSMQRSTEAIAKQMELLEDPSVKVYKSCDYTSDGTVFGYKHLGCGAGFSAIYTDVSPEKAAGLTELSKQTFAKSNIHLSTNDGGKGTNDLAVYVYDQDGIPCALTSTYYGDAVNASDRYDDSPKTGEVLYIALDCSLKAKAEYFPVSN